MESEVITGDVASTLIDVQTTDQLVRHMDRHPSVVFTVIIVGQRFDLGDAAAANTGPRDRFEVGADIGIGRYTPVPRSEIPANTSWRVIYLKPVFYLQEVT